MDKSYDASLVLLSITVAIIASYVALDLASRIEASRDSKAARYWLVGGAASMGIGIWSMHFIGMLALRLPMAMSYDVPITLLSLAIACLVSGFALYTMSHGSLSLRRLLRGGALMGVGIASMHYTGMAAMQMQPPIRYQPLLLGLSILIAIVAAVAALWIAFRLRFATHRSAFQARTGSALIMGAAIAGMHYTGMSAAQFAPNSVCTVSPQDINNTWLACAVAIFAVLSLAATLLISLFDLRLTDRSAKFAAELRSRNQHLATQAVELSQANALLHGEMRERTRAQRALQESEARFRKAFDSAAIGMALVSPAGRWLQVNAAFCKLMGYSEPELLALSFQDVTHPDDLSANLEYVRQVLNAEIQTYEMEKRYLHKLGHVVWVLLSVSLVRDEDNVPLHFIAQIQDITARKAAEHAVHESEERFQLVVQGTHDGIWDWNVVTGECYYSPRYRELLGCTGPLEPLRAAFESRLHPDDRATTLAALRAHFERRAEYDVMYRLRTEAGPYRWFHARGQACWDPAGNPVRFTGALRDITQQKETELALRASEERFRGLTQLSADWFWEQDEQFRFITQTGGGLASMNITPEHMLGKTRWELPFVGMTPEAWAGHKAMLEAHWPFHDLELCRRNDAGELRYVSVSGEPVYDAAGRFTGYRGVGRDITAAKRVERALVESEESHRLLAENSSDMIVRITPDGVVTYASPASLPALGYQPDELVGREVPEFIHPENREQSLRLYGEVVRHNVVNVVTCRLRRRDGTWTWTETSFRAVRDAAAQRTVQVIGVSRNVDERLRVTEALNRFKYVLDHTLDMIYIFDAQTLRFTYVNQGAANALGYPIEKLVGMAPWELRDGVTEAEYRNITEPFLRGEIQSRQFETLHRRADGTELPVDITMQMVRRPGEPGIFISVIRDASERKKVERMKNEFVSTVSHELRTPLTSIRGSLGLIAGGAVGELTEKAKKLIHIAHHNSERLVRLINDILDMEKIESGKMRFDVQPHRIGPLLEQALDANRAYGEQLRVRFELVGEIPDRVVAVDSDRFMQVMANLLSNAAKFSPSPGTVEVTAGSIGKVVRISVTDHGPGIPEDFRSKIFGKFSQADASDSRQKGGTGLGLSIAKAIVEKHGGEVGFETRIGQGTTFHVSFPETPGSSTEETTALTSAHRVPAGEDDGDARALTAAAQE